MRSAEIYLRAQLIPDQSTVTLSPEGIVASKLRELTLVTLAGDMLL